ncbi:MAG: hypothetical protein JW395_1097 [Nitrospira sp.]|nr:hypothetical protein [Nitrospira sp.]
MLQLIERLLFLRKGLFDSTELLLCILGRQLLLFDLLHAEQDLLLNVPFLLVGDLDLEEMGLIFLVGLQVGQPRLHFFSVRFMRLKILFVRPPLLDESLHRNIGLLM